MMLGSFLSLIGDKNYWVFTIWVKYVVKWDFFMI